MELILGKIALRHPNKSIFAIDSPQGKISATCACSVLRHGSECKYISVLPKMNLVQWALTQIARFMRPTWDPPGSCRPQMGPMLATSGKLLLLDNENHSPWESPLSSFCLPYQHSVIYLHCCQLLTMGSQSSLSITHCFYSPHFNKVERGIPVSSGPSVRPSIHLSIRLSIFPSVCLWTESCLLCIFNTTRRMHFIFAHLIKQLQKVCHV